MTAATALVPPADDLPAWLSTHLAARFDDREEEVGDGAETTVASLAEVLADDGAFLRRIHRRMVEDPGTQAPAAATYLADWWAGTIAGAVGLGLATADVGLLVDGDPGAIRFHVHPDGRPFRLELPARGIVQAGHPWAGGSGVDVVSEPDDITTPPWVARSGADGRHRRRNRPIP